MNKLATFATKYKDLLYLLGFVLTGVGIVYSVGIKTGEGNLIAQNQETFSLVMEQRLVEIEKADVRRDSLMNKTAIVVEAMYDRLNCWEDEHIQLLKKNNIYPKKLYRGDPK